MFDYPVILAEDDNGTFLVTFPDVPEAHSFGDTEDEALDHASEALEAALSFYIDAWRDLPKPSPARRRRMVCPSLKGVMKLAIYQAMKEQKLRKTDLGRRMGVALMQVERLLDLTHLSRIEQLESAFRSLGKRVGIELEDA